MAVPPPRWLFPLLWLGWCAGWAALAIGAKPARWREGRLSRALHIVPLLLAVLALFLDAPADALWFRPLLPPSPAWFRIGAAAAAAGFALTFWARLHLAGNWSGLVTLKHGHELITSGPYSLVRHPIYSGLLLAFLGTALPRGDLRAAAAFLLAFLALWRKARLEEKMLAGHFGSAYLAYRGRSKALIPFII